MTTTETTPLTSLISFITERAATHIRDRDPVLAEIRAAAHGNTALLGQAAGVYRAALADPAAACLFAARALWLCVDAGANLDVARATTPFKAAQVTTTCRHVAVCDQDAA